VQSVMVIGHNPGLADLALLLARAGANRHELEAKFPTGALATLAFNGAGWAALEPGGAELVDFVRPRDLES
jgi:phosphohistidine phosphatase